MVRWLAALVASFFASSALANQVTVDVRTLKMNDLATITVTLEGSFAANDYVDVPLHNLSFVGEPSVSSEFAWINGDVTRRKVFRYRARPIAPGAARVGPIELSAEDGQAERLNAIALTVEADRAAATNDAEQIVRELQATGRDLFFVVAEIEKQSVYQGEPVVITWVMYNGSSLQQWQVVNIPKLADFWSEELTREERPERLYVADVMVQRMPIRRVALYPLRSGRLRVEGMTVEGAIMRGSRRGPFSMYEGTMVEAAFTSAPVDLDVKPIPPGTPVDAVGDFVLNCEPPLQRGNGPAVLRVSLVGRGNVRAALPPRFERPVDGTLQVEGGAVSIDRDSPGGEMTRRWNYLVFPSTGGPLEIPPLTLRTFAPAKNARQELRCASAFLDVVAVREPEPAKSTVPEAQVRRPIPWRWIGGGAALLVAALIAFPRVRRELALRREARQIVEDATPAEIRARMEARVQIDVREASDRGDAWRSLRSLLDAADRERDIAVNAEDELVRRVREVLRIAR
ncbi:MAG TPA: BatD family protein [Thermoanaerobaculia bacterium]